MLDFRFNDITLCFSSAEDQLKCEEECEKLNILIWSHDTELLMTTFDISGCNASDLSIIFDRIEKGI